MMQQPGNPKTHRMESAPSDETRHVAEHGRWGASENASFLDRTQAIRLTEESLLKGRNPGRN